MKSLISAKVIPVFYFIFGLIFLFFPQVPHENFVYEESLNGEIISLTFTREIGILFIVIAILIFQIYAISKKVYRLMNTTFLFIMLLLSFIGPVMYFFITPFPKQILVTTVINICFFFIYVWERQQ